MHDISSLLFLANASEVSRLAAANGSLMDFTISIASWLLITYTNTKLCTFMQLNSNSIVLYNIVDLGYVMYPKRANRSNAKRFGHKGDGSNKSTIVWSDFFNAYNLNFSITYLDYHYKYSFCKNILVVKKDGNWNVCGWNKFWHVIQTAHCATCDRQLIRPISAICSFT